MRKLTLIFLSLLFVFVSDPAAAQRNKKSNPSPKVPELNMMVYEARVDAVKLGE